MCRLARGAMVVALALIAAASDAGTAAPPGDRRADPGRVEASGSASPRPGYDCFKGGFCGIEGWAYGSYAADTKESTGCGVDKDGVDIWEVTAAQPPTLPDFARPYCAFFYGFAACSLPTVVCEN